MRPVNGSASFKMIRQPTNVHGEETWTKTGVTEPALRHFPQQRHLSALEAQANGPAGPRFLPLVPLATGFAMSAAFATPEAFGPVLCTRTRLKSAQIHINFPRLSM
jgi:hypothetical protein